MEENTWYVALQARRHDADEDALPRLHTQIWTRILEFLESYFDADSVGLQVLQRYLDEMEVQELGFSIGRAAEGRWHLTFPFPDLDGRYTCSAAAVCYWSRVAFAACRADLQDDALGHGWSIDAREDVQDVLRVDTDQGLFVKLRDDLWLIEGVEDEFYIDSDITSLTHHHLDEVERTRVREVIRSRCSGDALTSMLLPNAAWDAWLIELPRSADAFSREAVFWYGGNVARPSLALIEAMLGVGATLDSEKVHALDLRLGQIGARAPDAALAPIRQALGHAHPNVRALGLAALAGFCDRERAVDASPALRDAVLALLHDQEPANLIAASHLHLLRQAPEEARAIEQVLGLLAGASLATQLRHDLLLGLFNLHLDRIMPDQVLAAFTRETRHLEPLVHEFAAWVQGSGLCLRSVLPPVDS